MKKKNEEKNILHTIVKIGSGTQKTQGIRQRGKTSEIVERRKQEVEHTRRTTYTRTQKRWREKVNILSDGHRDRQRTMTHTKSMVKNQKPKEAAPAAGAVRGKEERADKDTKKHQKIQLRTAVVDPAAGVPLSHTQQVAVVHLVQAPGAYTLVAGAHRPAHQAGTSRALVPAGASRLCPSHSAEASRALARLAGSGPSLSGSRLGARARLRRAWVAVLDRVARLGRGGRLVRVLGLRRGRFACWVGRVGGRSSLLL